MAYTRAVFILDVSVYVDFIEEFLESLKTTHPWLMDSGPIDKNWQWCDFPEGQLTQKEMLIDWIICEELSQVFCIGVKDHYKNNTFHRIYNQLVTQCDLRTYTTRYLVVPKIYGDAMAYVVRRKNGGLHIHYDLRVITPTLNQMTAR